MQLSRIHPLTWDIYTRIISSWISDFKFQLDILLSSDKTILSYIFH